MGHTQKRDRGEGELGLLIHMVVYVAVNAYVGFIPGMAYGWGIGLFFHGFKHFRKQGIK